MPPPLARRRFLQLCVGGLLGASACGDGSGERGDVAGDAGVPAPERRAYGDHDQAFGDLWLPDGATGPVPVVVLVHGGFWGAGFGLDLMDGLAASVAAAGWAAWNVEYRRLGSGGGYPETFDDVAAAVDHLADVEAPLDLDRVAIVGHSAGGQLAAWAASRPSLPPEAPRSAPAVVPSLVVPQAGVLDLVDCAATGLGGSACPELVGGRPDDVPERYAWTSPLALVPPAATVLAVHGTADDIVPLAQSERYVEAVAAAGGAAELRAVPGADHFDVIDPEHGSWRLVLDALAAELDAR
ncbi:MAG: alpha/beta hydrolase family protein [Acidimicrobiia bacterium]